MAILRGGKRIGGFDIRIGLPRDRSLDNVGSDPRIGQKAGPSGVPIVKTSDERLKKAAQGAKSANIQRGSDLTGDDSKRNYGQYKESVIGRFLANVGEGSFARPNRYLIVIYPPVSLIESQNELTSPQMLRNVGMMCNKIEFPSRDINSQEVITYGPKRNMPYAYSFPGSIEATFYSDKYLKQRAFFENWQLQMFNSDTHNMNFYQNYIGQMDIYQLSTIMKYDDDADLALPTTEITYAVRLYEVYPETISTVGLGMADNDSITEIPIKLSYRTWRNLSLEGIQNASSGEAFSNYNEEKRTINFNAGEGDFIPTTDIRSISPLQLGTKDLSGSQAAKKGFLDKLPPELKRAGRDIINQVKRNLPIGRVTGGRVFPPFL